MLREVEEALSDRRRDLARVNADLDSATHRCRNGSCCCPLVLGGGVDVSDAVFRRLSAALSDCQDARNRLDSLCKQVNKSSSRSPFRSSKMFQTGASQLKSRPKFMTQK